MVNKRSPEVTVLLMACTLELSEEKKAQLIQFLGGHPINWDRMYTLAVRHKVTPFLYRALQEIPSVPESFLSTLQNDCRLIATDNLLKLHQYKLLTKRFADNGIDHIALKGIYLVTGFYPDSSLRGIGDFDVLVRKEDVFKSIRLLEADDYHPEQKYTLYGEHNKQTMLSDLHEVSLIKPFFNKSYFDLDLHWKFICFNKHHKIFELKEILAKQQFLVEFQIILLVTHHGVSSLWQTINYINDLYFLIHNQLINWPWLLQEMRRNGLEQVFLVGLYWCQQIWELPVPSSIQELLMAQNSQSLAEGYEKNWEASEPISSSTLILGQLMYFLKGQTEFSRQLKILFTFCTSRIFRYSTFKLGRRVVYVPKQLGFIAVFIRALRSLLRFIPALREPLR